METKALPWSNEAEQSVLGGILLNGAAMVEVVGRLEPGDFYHPAHAAIYRAMVALDADGMPIDMLTVMERMRAQDSLSKLKAFGEGYFVELTGAVVTIENIGYHAKLVRGKATARRLIQACQEIAAHGYGDYGDIESFLARAQESVFRVASRDVASTLVSQEQSLRATVKQIEEAMTFRQEQGRAPGVPTPFTRLNEHLGGGLQAEYVVIGGRPSSGKSSLVLDMAEYPARYFGVPALIISTEMRHEALTMRALAAEAGIDGWKLRSGELTPGELARVSRAAGNLSTALIHYEDSAKDLQSIRAIARRWRSNPVQGGRRDKDGNLMPATVVCDYIQEVELRNQRDDDRGRGRQSNREQEVSDVSKGLKQLGQELGATMIAVTSLNRELEKRPDKRPKNSDLRESGALEFQADVIMFVYRDVVYNPKADPLAAEVLVTKMRNGKLGTVNLQWREEFTRFYDLPDDAQQALPSAAYSPNPYARGGESE